MVIFINHYGCHLSKQGMCICVRNEEGEKLFPAELVDTVMLSVPCGMTADFLKLCADQNTDVVMLDGTGKPVCGLTRFGGSNPGLKRKQLLMREHPIGVELVRTLQTKKIERRAEYLENLTAYRKGDLVLKEAVRSMRLQQARIESLGGSSVLEVRDTLQGIEGIAGRYYSRAYAHLLPDDCGFTQRLAEVKVDDPVNMFLNYGYGFLYRRLERECAVCRLDASIGVMHADQYSQPAFVFDLIEPHRWIVEKTILILFMRHKLREGEHYLCSDGCTMTSEGKAVVVNALLENMEKKLVIGHRRRTMEESIRTDVRMIADKIAAA